MRELDEDDAKGEGIRIPDHGSRSRSYRLELVILLEAVWNEDFQVWVGVLYFLI
jgi:hypothetical protein